MFRIRFKNENGVLNSKPILINQNMYQLVIDTNLLEYSVYLVQSQSEKELLTKGTGKSQQMVRIKGRKAILSLGAQLEKEVRNRNNNTSV